MLDGYSTAERSGSQTSRVLAFGLSVCRPHLMPSGVLMPSILRSSFHAVLPFQTKNAGAPHSPQVHLQAKQTSLTMQPHSEVRRQPQELSSGGNAGITHRHHEGQQEQHLTCVFTSLWVPYLGCWEVPYMIALLASNMCCSRRA